ncbi:hypothetical protein [Streptomyces sp. NPDC013181]|uniref:hypothetical protein n=1 Tax=Streptomyces sp. NPDC013181 TaxID=3364864 RepID=UPI0036C167FF
MSVTVAWMAWVIAVRPQVTLTDRAITVRNWVTESVIPYRCITRVGVSNGLTFELADGSKIKGRVVSPSLIGQIAGYPSAKLIRNETRPFLGGERIDENEGVRQTFTLSLSVPLTVLTFHALLYGFLRYILHAS